MIVEDWMRKAAVEIVTASGRLASDSDSVEIVRAWIAKHCPFEADVAYMPVKKQTVAEQYFELVGTELELDDAVILAAGFDPEDPRQWPFGSMIYDDYDSSFELQGTKGNWAPSIEQVQALLALGFARGWVVYTDGMERYYCTDRYVSERTKGSAHRAGPREQSRREYLLAKRIAILEARIDEALPNGTD